MIATFVLAVSCSSSSKPSGTPRCTLSSQCTGTEVCALGYCVPACNGSKDCPTGERCVQPDPAVPDSFACQAPEVSKCQYNSQCATLFCASDGQCRSECLQQGAMSADCPLGLNGLKMDCAADPVRMTNFCVDPVADAATYDPATMMIIPQSTGAGGSAGVNGAAGVNGTGTGGSGAGGKGGSGAGGHPVSACTNPQTAFLNVATGDANANFVNGVAARVAGRLLIFSAYVGPALDLGAGGASAGTGAGGAGGAAPMGNYIWVQSFDPTTGASMGPSTPLFKAVDGTNFGLWSAAVSSAGEVALLYGTGNSAGNHNSLSAAFISSSAAGAAPGVQLEKTVVIESAELGNVGAFWSEANAEFVFYWKYNTNGWQIRTKKFQGGGTPAGGDTSAVNASGSSVNDSGYSFGVGASGHLFGVAFRRYADGWPMLTNLDADGNTVGTPTALDMGGTDRWINVGGTTKGFVVLYQRGNTANGLFIPKLPDDSGIVIPSGAGGAGGAGGASGSSMPWTTFSIQSTATSPNIAYTVGDELGAGGVGTVYRESNGASFLYTTADGAKRYAVGTVISYPSGSTVSITNYAGSFSVSLFEPSLHLTQAIASGCTP